MKSITCMDLIYKTISFYPNQKMEIGDIIREMSKLPQGDKFSGETVRRHVADMTFHENSKYLQKYPCIVRHGDGIYSFNPALNDLTLEKFFVKKSKKKKKSRHD